MILSVNILSCSLIGVFCEILALNKFIKLSIVYTSYLTLSASLLNGLVPLGRDSHSLAGLQ